MLSLTVTAIRYGPYYMVEQNSMTVERICWQNHYIGVTNNSTRSPISKSCLKNKPSPTFITNIDLTILGTVIVCSAKFWIVSTSNDHTHFELSFESLNFKYWFIINMQLQSLHFVSNLFYYGRIFNPSFSRLNSKLLIISW